jgi:hypothetical protein
MKKLMFTLLTILLMSCTSSNDFDKGQAILENQGFTEIQSTGYDLFCCGEEDTFSTGFTAKDKEGNMVEGCICSGVLKGVTIRFQ